MRHPLESFGGDCRRQRLRNDAFPFINLIAKKIISWGGKPALLPVDK
jgi:hypothetical protein